MTNYPPGMSRQKLVELGIEEDPFEQYSEDKEENEE